MNTLGFLRSCALFYQFLSGVDAPAERNAILPPHQVDIPTETWFVEDLYWNILKLLRALNMVSSGIDAPIMPYAILQPNQVDISSANPSRALSNPSVL